MNINPIVLSIPVFFVLISIELLVQQFTRQKALDFVLVVAFNSVVNCRVLFEQRKWLKWAEWTRVFLYPLILSILTSWLGWQLWFHGLSRLYFLISFVWFYSVQRQHAQLQMV